jgi:hypothetical protein
MTARADAINCTGGAAVDEEFDEGTLPRRLGNFSLEDQSIYEQPQIVMMIMASVIVVRAEHLLLEKCVNYCAMSPQFEELANGEVIPTYEPSYDEDTGEVSWTRKPKHGQG